MNTEVWIHGGQRESAWLKNAGRGREQQAKIWERRGGWYILNHKPKTVAAGSFTYERYINNKKNEHGNLSCYPLAGGGGWVGGLCWWCESRRSQPDQGHTSAAWDTIPFYFAPGPPSPNNQQKHLLLPPPLQWPTDTLPGLTASTSAHARSHTISHCGSQSVSTTGIIFPFLSFFSLLGFSSFIVGEGWGRLSLCVCFLNRNRKDW